MGTKLVALGAPILLWMIGAPLVVMTGALLWIRSLQRRRALPRFAMMVGYGLVIVSAVLLQLQVLSIVDRATTLSYQVVSGDRPVCDAAARSRLLASGIAEGMNVGVLLFATAPLPPLWLGAFAWRAKRRAACAAAPGAE